MPRLVQALFGVILFGALTAAAQAANCFAVANANWNVAATWASLPGGVAGTCAGNGAVANTPGPADNASIGEVAVRTVTIPAGYAAKAAAVVIGGIAAAGASTLTLGSNTASLTVSGNLTLNRPGNASTNALNVNAGTVTVGGNVSLSGTAVQNNRIAKIAITTGTMSVTGSLTFGTAAAATAATNVLDMSGGAGTFNLANAFTLTNGVGTLTPGVASTFNYNGSAAAQTVLIGASLVVYNNLSTNNTNVAGATLSAAITTTNVTGNLAVQSGTLNNGPLAGGFAIAGNGTKTFSVSSGATFTMNTGTAVFPTGFGTYTFGATSTTNYLQSNAQNISVQAYGHLNVKPAANSITHTFMAGTTAVAGDLTVGNGTNTGVIVTAATNSTVLNVTGSVTININTTLVANASNAFTVGGNWTNSGGFTHSSGTVSFNGTAAQAITGATTFMNLAISNTSQPITVNPTITVNGNVANSGTLKGAGEVLLSGGSAAHALTGTGSYTNLELNDSQGATIAANTTVKGTLILTSGIVTTSTNTLVTTTACSTPSVSRTSGYVAGRLQKNIAVTGSCTFEVGDSGNYRPITLNFSTLASTGSLVGTVSQSAGAPSELATSLAPPLDTGKRLDRYWTLSAPVPTASAPSGQYSATLQFVSGDIVGGATCANLVVGRYSAGWFIKPPTTSTAPTCSGTYSITGSNMQPWQYGDFVVGEPVSFNFRREMEFIHNRERYY